jgi:hypothetical protein
MQVMSRLKKDRNRIIFVLRYDSLKFWRQIKIAGPTPQYHWAFLGNDMGAKFTFSSDVNKVINLVVTSNSNKQRFEEGRVKKADIYWPDVGTSFKYGNVSVFHKAEKHIEHGIILRTFEVIIELGNNRAYLCRLLLILKKMLTNFRDRFSSCNM